jgi:hypothetical protein
VIPITSAGRPRAHIEALQQEETPMIKRPSFPVYRTAAVPARASRQSFDRRLTIAAVALAIIVAGALLVRATGPIETPSDPDSYLIGP